MFSTLTQSPEQFLSFEVEPDADLMSALIKRFAFYKRR